MSFLFPRRQLNMTVESRTSPAWKRLFQSWKSYDRRSNCPPATGAWGTLAQWPHLSRIAFAALLLACIPLSSCISITGADVLLAAGFSLSTDPTTVSLVAGGTGQQISVNVLPVNGFTGPVTVTISGLPAGVTVNPSTFTLTPGTPQSVTITAAANAAVSDPTVTLTGTWGNLSRTATVTLNIIAAAPVPNFSLTSTPVTIALVAGGTGKQISVNAVPANGFTGMVAVAISGLPTGVTANPPTLTLIPGTAQNVMLTAAANAAAGTPKVTFTGTSGALSHAATVDLTISEAPPPPDFSLTATPTTLALVDGSPGKEISVEAVPANGFTGMVTVAISGLPTGVTANPTSLTLTPGSAQNVTLTADATATVGKATVTFTGTSGTLKHTATVTVTTSAEPNFSLTATPTTLSIQAGSTGKSVSVEAVPTNGLTATVTVAISGLPTGVTANPATLTLTPGTAQSVTLTAAANATVGKATVTFTGTSGTLTHMATITLTVTAPPPPPNFSLTATPATLSIQAGSTGKPVSVEAVAVNGFTGTVTVAISGLPTGVTANPTSLTLTPGTAQSVTLTAVANATVGKATVTFTGTSGALTHTATVALTVTAAANFTLTATPGTLPLTAGATGSPVSLNAVPANGFAAAVTVTISGLPSGVTANPTTLTLTPGTAQSITLTASSSAAAGNTVVTFTGTSGALVHTATVTVEVTVPPPSFTLTVMPTSLTLVIGATGSPVSVNAVPANGFTAAVTVTLSGLPTGVTANPPTLTLTPGTAQSTTLTAASTSVASAENVTFTGTSGALMHTATLTLTVQTVGTTTVAPDVTTYHYDVARDGLNAQETILTLTNVNSTLFGKIGFDTVDGLVDAEPLYLANVTAGGILRNVLYVATEGDSVYAFDADTGAQIWKTSVIGTGETTSDNRGCSQVTPQIGITSTPVIDRTQGTNGTIFVVGMTKDSGGNYHHRLHALDVTTGAELGTSPTEITASYPGTGDGASGSNVIFAPAQYKERAALLLSNGTIYISFASHCDNRPYTGWIMGYSESTLLQTQVLDVTPNGNEGAIWMAGDGIAADSSGNLYFLDANGTFDTTTSTSSFPAKSDYGNAMIKLSTSPTLAVADFFNTYNTVTESDEDEDLGSGGEIIVPNQTDSNGVVHQLMVGAGKDSNIYIADCNNMGKFQASPANDSNIYQEVTGALGGGVFSTPAFFNGVLYYGAVGEPLKAFPMTNAKLATTSSSQSSASFSSPGTTPSISANGTANGIVWALESNMSSAGVLHAYNATNLALELYNSTQASGGRDSFGNGNKFITPMIVNGKVYVGTQTGVAVFGLLAP
jgi:hypothetical protein